MDTKFTTLKYGYDVQCHFLNVISLLVIHKLLMYSLGYKITKKTEKRQRKVEDIDIRNG